MPYYLNEQDSFDLISRLDGVSPDILNWYMGFSDAGFWSSGDSYTTLPLPENFVTYGTAHRTGLHPFSPGILWDVIIANDDGYITLFRIVPQDDPQHLLMDFGLTENDGIPEDFSTQSREDFIAEYERQRLIIESRYAYIPGSNK